VFASKPFAVSPSGKRVGWSSWGETPNGLSASATLAEGHRECQCYFAITVSIPKPSLAFQHQIDRQRVYRLFQFHERSQLFIRMHNETLSVAAMCVCNPDCSPVGINRRNAAPTPTRFAEIVSDDFPLLHPDETHYHGLVGLESPRGTVARELTARLLIENPN
jgi:hypothetical protein